MKGITTNRTNKEPAMTVRPSNISTPIASLARVVAVDENHGLAEQFSFVLDETQELPCAPIPYKASRLLSSLPLSLHTSSPQFFEGDSIALLIHDCFGDAVVDISDEPSLSSGQFLQVSPGGTSACSLKASPQILISSFDFTKLSAIEEGIVREDSGIIYPPIHTQYPFYLSPFCGINLTDYIEEDSSPFYPYPCGTRTLEIISLEISGDSDIILSPTRDCAQAHFLDIWQESEGIMIESHRGILSLDRFFPELESLEHVAGLVSDRSNEATVEFGIGFSYLSIGEMMQSGLIERLCLHARVYTLLTGLIAQVDCLLEVFIPNDFRLDCYVHKYPLKHNLFKYVVLFSSDESQENETFSLQHKLSLGVVSEVSQEGPGWRGQDHRGEYYQRSVQPERLGIDRTISRTRPYPCLRIRATHIFADVRGQGHEGLDSGQSHQSASFCQEVLESELLRWHRWDSDGTDHPEVHPRTRDKEVMSQFPTASRTQCPLAT